MKCISIIVISYFLFTQSVFAMDQSDQPYTLSAFIPISLQGVTDGIAQCVASSFGSVSSTLTNQLSDAAAFKKLGWPPEDDVAQKELQKSIAVYKRVNAALQSHILDYPECEADHSFISRRYQYCQRALNVLNSYPDSVNLALYCLQYHKQVMNDFDLKRFLTFVTLHEEAIKKNTLSIDQAWARIKAANDGNK